MMTWKMRKEHGQDISGEEQIEVIANSEMRAVCPSERAAAAGAKWGWDKASRVRSVVSKPDRDELEQLEI